MNQAYGCQSMVDPLRRVLVRRPDRQAGSAWCEYGWRTQPDPAKLLDEHKVFCAELERASAEVVVAAAPLDGDPDAIYTYDPAIISNAGAVILRPGKAGRLAETDAMASDLAMAGVPIAARVAAPATAEGGDTLWLDDRTLVVGLGYRTNPEGALALEAALPGVNVITVDLPHYGGPTEVLHLMSLISPLDVDLAVVYLPLMPVRLVRMLADRGVRLVEVPDEEFRTMGPNVLALAPRVALALEGNPETRRRMEREGVDVRVYRGEEISRKGDGGPTCLTRPILRC